jgi:hypothetical protein
MMFPDDGDRDGLWNLDFCSKFVWIIGQEHFATFNHRKLQVIKLVNWWNLRWKINVRFTTKKSTFFWDITPCSPVRVNWRFRGTCHLQVSKSKLSRKRNTEWSRQQVELCWFLAYPTPHPWRLREYFSPKCWLTSIRLHGNMFQRVQLSIATAMWTSDPTGLTIKFANFPLCSCCGSSGQKPQCVSKLCFWSVAVTFWVASLLSECVLVCHHKNVGAWIRAMNEH